MHNTMMNALMWLGPRDLVMQEVPKPTLQADEVLVKVTATGICGSELSGYLGENSLRVPPLIMGHEAAGEIVDLGGDVPQHYPELVVGKRVTFNPLVTCGQCDLCNLGRDNLCRERKLMSTHLPGSFAQYIAVPAAQCLTLTEQVSDVLASLTEPVACSLRTVKLSQIDHNSRLLILGAGPIGLLCLAIAKAQGVESVFITDVQDSRLELAKVWGADEVWNATTEDIVSKAQQHSADVVIDAVGTTVTRDQAVKAVLPGGTVVFIGLHAEESVIAANYLIRQEVSIVGTFAYTQADFKEAHKLIEEGLITSKHATAAGWLEEQPLSAGRDAFEALVAGTSQASKIILRPFES